MKERAASALSEVSGEEQSKLQNAEQEEVQLNLAGTEDPAPQKTVESVCEELDITPILYKSLFNGNPKDRFFILRLERDLRSFISSETVSWRLQPLNSYYRLLVHQIAAYYAMGHILLKDGASMVIFKENTSIVNGNNISKTDPSDIDSKLKKIKLSDIPNDLFPEVEISNDISDDFLVKNGFYHNPHQHQQYQYRQMNNMGGQRPIYPNGRNGKYHNNKSNNGSAPGTPINNKLYKLIKRKEGSPSQSSTPEVESSNTTLPDVQTDSSLEDERLSKEEIYNKTREEIFQTVEGEEEDEEEEEEGSDVDQGSQTESTDLSSTLDQNKEQYQRRPHYKYYNNTQNYMPYIPNQMYPSYGYYAPPPPQLPMGAEGYDEEMANQLIMLQQYQLMYANAPGVPQGYYYPMPQYNNRRGGYGYGKRGNYNGHQTNKRYYNGNNKNGTTYNYNNNNSNSSNNSSSNVGEEN